jgi:antirestriction protein
MIRICVANLGTYNRGSLIGKWLNLPMDGDNLREEIDAIMKTPDPARTKYDIDEEWAIHDYETEIGLKINEYESPFKLNELAEKLEELDDWELDILECILDDYPDIDWAMNILAKGRYSVYTGIKNREDLGYAMVDEGLLGEIPDSLVNYIDYEAFGLGIERDLYCGEKRISEFNSRAAERY